VGSLLSAPCYSPKRKERMLGLVLRRISVTRVARILGSTSYLVEAVPAGSGMRVRGWAFRLSSSGV
jgi:hypothetical protein